MKVLVEVLNEILNFILAAFYALLGFFWRLPDSREGYKNPVILIPGLLGSPLVFWQLRRRLIKEEYPVYTPWLSYQTAHFEESARTLEQFILENNLRDVYIIGHATGGLIVTQMGYKGRDRIKKFFSLSTPFHGSLMGLLFYFLPAGRQSVRGSAFIKNNEINFMTFPNLQCLYSSFDLAIIPGFQGKLGRSDDTEYPGLGHFNLLMSPKGIRFILEKLELEDSKDEKPKVKKIPAKAEDLKGPKKPAPKTANRKVAKSTEVKTKTAKGATKTTTKVTSKNVRKNPKKKV